MLALWHCALTERQNVKSALSVFVPVSAIALKGTEQKKPVSFRARGQRSPLGGKPIATKNAQRAWQPNCTCEMYLTPEWHFLSGSPNIPGSRGQPIDPATFTGRGRPCPHQGQGPRRSHDAPGRQ